MWILSKRDKHEAAALKYASQEPYVSPPLSELRCERIRQVRELTRDELSVPYSDAAQLTGAAR